MSEPLIGSEFIRSFAKNLSTSPGVYRMMDVNGDVLYVGKAKNLKNRVTSYAVKGVYSNRIFRMISQTAAMEVVTTRSEAEALLLEANLIKTFRPRYNILLKDDKSYPYIMMTDSHPFPRIVKYRGAQKKGESYFGPFASAGAVNHSLALLQKAFLLRPCADTIFKNRSRPCLQYQIKRCSAPCVRYVNEEEYGALVRQAKDFLSGKNREVQEAIFTEMREYSVSEQYEKAAQCRDRIRALTQIQQEQNNSTSSVSDADVIACYKEGDSCCVQVFFFRSGQNFGNKSSFLSAYADNTESDILEAFILQFYQSHPPPREIILSHEIADSSVLEEALSTLTTYKVNVSLPQRGARRQIVDDALKNAKMALSLKLSERQTEQARLEEFAELFGLPEPPSRIEVYDNSHIMGTHAVGAMIVASPEGLDKKSYRRFNIRREELTPGDDYGMMREVLTRRLSRLAKEDPDRDQGIWPDFLLIDGGKGHMSTVCDILVELGIADLPFACIAKGVDRNAGREWFHMPGKDAFQLPENSPLLYYIQRLRDEAHRFAISSHRIKRANALRASALDEIPGIGSGRKKALLNHFGSSKDVEKASLTALEAVPGISKQVAKKIYAYFHGTDV
ncbi:MAG: excinuclease ABC subunit UvrC [Rickettsiales bacterium]